MPTEAATRQVLFPSFSPVIERLGAKACRDPETLIGASDRHEVFYIPFEHIERRARLVIVGITPGTTQLGLAYAKTQELQRAGTSVTEILRIVKSHAAFGGSMRTNLLRMLRHFGFASILGVSDEEDLWGSAANLLHSTSVVPHAAFEDGKMFNGSFDDVLRSPILRDCFESHFVTELALLPSDAVFVALGDTPLGALDHCASRGLIPSGRILGAFAHPSGSGGSQVGVYLGERDPSGLSPRDPVRHRVPRLLAQAARMREAAERLKIDTNENVLSVPKHAGLSEKTPPKKSVPASPAGATQPIGRETCPNELLEFVVSRGRFAGTTLRPHIHADGCYVVSPTRFKSDYIRVQADELLEGFLEKGLSLRMSAPDVGPSLISPGSIRGRSA